MNCAKTLFFVCAALLGAGATGEPPTARVAGVDVPLNADGKPAPMDEQRRHQILENLRASFAARGVPAKTETPVVARDGASRATVGLDLSLIAVARIAADGTLETHCVQGAEPAAEFLAAAEAAADKTR